MRIWNKIKYRLNHPRIAKVLSLQEYMLKHRDLTFDEAFKQVFAEAELLSDKLNSRRRIFNRGRRIVQVFVRGGLYTVKDTITIPKGCSLYVAGGTIVSNADPVFRFEDGSMFSIMNGVTIVRAANDTKSVDVENGAVLVTGVKVETQDEPFNLGS